MARFSGNPIKNPLSGSEIIPATDPSTTDDIGLTPAILTNYSQQNMGLATGSAQGLISGANADKLTALPTDAQLQQLLEVAFPLFIGAPTDGVQSIYTHLLDPQWEFTNGYGAVSAGSTNLTITINGTPVNGWNNIPITSTGAPFPTTLDASATLPAGSTLGLTLAGTTGNCANMRFSMKASSVLA